MNEEIGFNQMMKEVFNQEKTLDDPIHFIEENIEKISILLKNKKLSIKSLISVSAIPAYIHINETFSNNLQSYIKENIRDILKELESITIDLSLIHIYNYR